MAKGKSAKQRASAKAKVTKTKASASKSKKKQIAEPATKKPIPGSFRLSGLVFRALKKHWRPLGGILLVYILLNLIFATGLLSNISSTVSSIKNSRHSSISDGVSGFGNLLTGSGTNNQSTGMQTTLLVIESLVVIWALRHLLAGEKIGIKKAHYHSMAPLIPFLLVALVIILQLLPLTIGSAMLSLVLSSSISSGAVVGVIFTLLFIILATWSVYMLSSSIFALYIVTLPNIQPLEALRSAKNLVAGRRWQLIRRLLFLPLSIFLMIGVIVVPLIFVANFLTVAAFFVLSLAAVLYVHTYLYSLYRELL
jgi:hypothetical protein